MGQGMSMGDIFYRDNPKRRARAEELYNQIKLYEHEFKTLKATRDEVFQRSRDKLNKVLRDYGIHTPEDLEREVRKNVANSEDIRQYEQLKKSINSYDIAESLILDIVSLIGVITGVIIVVIGVAGVITGGAAFAALGIVGTIAALVTGLMLGLGILEGAREREKLNEAITTLWHKRSEISLCVEQMRVVTGWAESLENMLKYNLGDEVMKNYMSNGLKREYDAWTPDRINRQLREMDEKNHSYSDQDPWGVRYTSAVATEPPTATLIFTPSTGTPKKLVCTLLELTSKMQCTVRSGHDLWVIRAKAGAGDVPLENIRFDLDCNPAGHTSQQQRYKDYMLQISDLRR